MPHSHQDGFAVPPDVPAYVAQPVTFATGSTPTIVGDGTGTRGSRTQAIINQLPDIRSWAPGWILPSNESFPPPPLVTNLDTQEAKFRAHINVSHILPDDPIRNYGHPGASHLHEFFGAATTNAFSTFASLRNRANERSAKGKHATTGSGGPYNGTAYWVPAMMKGDHVVKMGGVSLYYTSNPARRSLRAQRLPRGLRYVTGFNMDDPDDLIVKGYIAAANAAHGSERYAYVDNGFTGWSMWDAAIENIILTKFGTEESPTFVLPDGTSPWAGTAGDNPGCWLRAHINGPEGHDGVNPWSPGGYKHVFHAVQDSTIGQRVIPQNWVWLPELQLSVFYQHQGWADFSQWFLSSDDHASMVAGRTIYPGGSYHTDWLGAWDDSVFGDETGWQAECVGVVDGAVMHTCGSGAFKGDGTRLLDGGPAPDGTRSPQVTTESYNTNNLSDMFAIPTTGFGGPVTLPARLPTG